VKVSTAATEATRYTGTFSGTTDQVSQVRREIARFFGNCPITDDLVLIASEISTNSILHSRSRGGSFTIRAELFREYGWLECEDAGGVWRSRQTDDRPHGLTIVEALAGEDGWGTEVTTDGHQVVWVRVPW
jgi:hypothetical protein